MVTALSAGRFGELTNDARKAVPLAARPASYLDATAELCSPTKVNRLL